MESIDGDFVIRLDSPPLLEKLTILVMIRNLLIQKVGVKDESQGLHGIH
ncbi:hypothetical protein [Bacillus sonorensis]|nr:hypothetical protein [Bacillus sonorensis]